MSRQGTGRASGGRGDGLLVVVGSASRDIDRRDPRGWRLGGGVTYGALAAARLGARVAAVIGLDDLAADPDELAFLREAGVDVRPVRLRSMPVFELTETQAGRVVMLHATGEPLDPAVVPPDLRGADAWLMAPVAGELDDAWAPLPAVGAMVALSWQGLLRRLAPGEPVTPRVPDAVALPARADLAAVSVEDLPPGFPLDRLLVHPRQELVITRGAAGGIHVQRDAAGAPRLRALPAATPRRIVDRVGAGDVFLAAWLTARMPDGPFGRAGLSASRALRLATLVAGLHIEQPGVDGVPRRAAVAKRLAEDPDPGPHSSS
jgi:sugar/nucleoside kinase (ribokinase family)